LWKDERSRRLADPPFVYYITNTQACLTPKKEPHMDFLRNMHPRDWVIAAAAFFAGALIF
jgi:hypothetical protein